MGWNFFILYINFCVASCLKQKLQSDLQCNYFRVRKWTQNRPTILIKNMSVMVVAGELTAIISVLHFWFGWRTKVCVFKYRLFAFLTQSNRNFSNSGYVRSIHLHNYVYSLALVTVHTCTLWHSPQQDARRPPLTKGTHSFLLFSLRPPSREALHYIIL